jgi:hypothetical protein
MDSPIFIQIEDDPNRCDGWAGLFGRKRLHMKDLKFSSDKGSSISFPSVVDTEYG